MRLWLCSAAAVCSLVVGADPALAQDGPNLSGRIHDLESLIAQQQTELAAQKAAIADQEVRLKAQEAALGMLRAESLGSLRGTGEGPPGTIEVAQARPANPQPRQRSPSANRPRPRRWKSPPCPRRSAS